MNIIELHDRFGGTPVFLNVEKIIEFHGHHELGDGWEFSVITLENRIQEVKETAEEIILAIVQANTGGKPVMSEKTILKYRTVATPALW